jgi:hypothetical protein
MQLSFVLTTRSCLSIRNNAVAKCSEGLQRGCKPQLRRRLQRLLPQGGEFLFAQRARVSLRCAQRYSCYVYCQLACRRRYRGGIKLIIGESDVDDYPGLWLHGNSNDSLSGTFPHYPLKEDARNDRDIRVAETADYIADTKGTRTFPWRILGIAENDGALITNQLVYLLAKPSQVQDTSWIKPGKVAWDWYNANNIWGVDFKSGINTQTYKYYIDFASKYGIQYIILDEGWYKLGNVLQVVPEMNVEELVAYGKQKNVGIILWVVWKSFDNQFDAAFDQYSKWGIKGLKLILCSATISRS